MYVVYMLKCLFACNIYLNMLGGFVLEQNPYL